MKVYFISLWHENSQELVCDFITDHEYELASDKDLSLLEGYWA